MSSVPAAPEPTNTLPSATLAAVNLSAAAAQMGAAVEMRCGGKACFSHSEGVHVDLPMGGVWDGEVYVFDLVGQDVSRRAYAWTMAVARDKPARVCVVLQLPSIASPEDAVLRTLGYRAR